ncbi:MAG: CvpA family protein [Oscillospiraceae bacterium]|nr:CvpA family protein [Oscillospiraceae bacterium]
MTAFLIDLAIIGTVVYCTWRGYRNGLIRGVFGVVALVVALIVANIAASAYSDEFEGLLIPFVGGIVDTTLADVAEGDARDEVVSSRSETERFQSAYSVLRQIGLPVAAANSVAGLAAGDGSERSFSDVIAGTLSSALAYIAVFAVAFVLVAIVFAIIGNLIGFVFSLPGLRLLDTIAGAMFGLAKGLIIVLTFSAFVRYFGLLALDILEDTAVLYYLVNNNIVADMLGI